MTDFDLQAIVAAVLTVKHPEWGSETAWKQAEAFLAKLERFKQVPRPETAKKRSGLNF